MRCPRAERAGSHATASAADELPAALPRPAPLSDHHAMPWTGRPSPKSAWWPAVRLLSSLLADHAERTKFVLVAEEIPHAAAAHGDISLDGG
eukprot:COSAG06_NODE_3960_length_4717_cov_11.330446_3_plen_92_part_00